MRLEALFRNQEEIDVVERFASTVFNLPVEEFLRFAAIEVINAAAQKLMPEQIKEMSKEDANVGEVS